MHMELVQMSWDRGILWIHCDGACLPLNADEALELLRQLQEEREHILAQQKKDREEGL